MEVTKATRRVLFEKGYKQSHRNNYLFYLVFKDHTVYIDLEKETVYGYYKNGQKVENIQSYLKLLDQLKVVGDGSQKTMEVFNDATSDL